MKKVCCELSLFSHTQERRDPYTNLVRVKNENQVAKWKTKESGFSWKDKKEHILAGVRTEIQKHEFQADSDRSIQELNGIIESQRREIDHTDSDVARSSKDIQRIEQEPNTQLSSTARLVTKWIEETLERTKFDRDTPN